MRITVPTNHHFYDNSFYNEEELWRKFGIKSKKDKRNLIQNLFTATYELNTSHQTHSQLKIIGFKNRKYKIGDDGQLILKLFAREYGQTKSYAVQTGLYAGIIFHKGYTFNITTNYGNVLLNRMLNFVNDIYVDKKDIQAEKKNNQNEFQSIIAYLFIQSLERAGVLGFPKQYQFISEKSTKVRGRINISTYLKKDFPFQGRLTTTYRSQVYIQEIIDVLFAACQIVEKHFGANYKSKIMGLYQTLNEHSSNVFVSPTIIEKAKNHSVLYNPLFSKFKDVLSYAEILLKNQDIEAEANNKKLATCGYLFDISQLFEVYLEKLLRKHFTEWDVNEQEELSVYREQFFGRKMMPDLIMKNKITNEVIVFDAKFKSMKGIKKDVDRSDFYQIHTYIQYYAPNVILGGLIYPLSKQSDNKSISTSLFGNEKDEVKFIIDGIFVNETMSSEELILSENQFLQRIETLIEISRINLKAS